MITPYALCRVALILRNKEYIKGDPLKTPFDINSSGVSMDPSSESASNGFAFLSLSSSSSSSSSGSNKSFFLMSSSLEIVGYTQLDEVEYVWHLISSDGTSFTPENRLQVLEFPPPATQKALLQFIELVNYYGDHIPQMTEMAKLLRELINQKKYKGFNKLDWTENSHKAFDFCRAVVSNC